MNLEKYNNIGISSIAIDSVLSESKVLSLSKALLIFPIFTSKPLTQYLGRKTTKIKSIEKLITDKTSFFSNFNNRYYDSIPHSLNSIQLLIESEVLSLDNGILTSKKDFIYDKKMGKRANEIYKASINVSQLLETDAVNLYLNLRIEL